MNGRGRRKTPVRASDHNVLAGTLQGHVRRCAAAWLLLARRMAASGERGAAAYARARTKGRAQVTYHTPALRVTIEVDGEAMVWDWPAGERKPKGPVALDDHTTFYFDLIAWSRRMKHGRWPGSPPMPLLSRDYADGEMLAAEE